MNPHPAPGPIPAGPSLRAPIAATVVLGSLWAIFTLFAWPLAGPIGAVADEVSSRLGLDVNAGKPKAAADTDAPADSKATPQTPKKTPKRPGPRTVLP